MKKVQELIDLVKAHDGIGNKEAVKDKIIEQFQLTKARSVYHCEAFAIRFSYSSGNSFSNTVLSLSNLKKYDSIPFLVCLVTPQKNRIYLANTTLLSKISHSSQELRLHNIKGSFNGPDIIKEFEGIENNGDNVETLFAFHQEFDFSENLVRLVEATNNIAPSGQKFGVTVGGKAQILDAVDRAIEFYKSPHFKTLQSELEDRVKKHSKEIMVASRIENVNIRGRLIEYLITEEDDDHKAALIEEINEEYSKLPKFKTKNLLGDHKRVFEPIITETDIKSKVVVLNSNPKAYNIDKFLELLSRPNTVFLFFFVGIDAPRIVSTQLVSVFQEDILNGTVYQKHWSGRNSRGVTQFMGTAIHQVLNGATKEIDRAKSIEYLKELINL